MTRLLLVLACVVVLLLVLAAMRLGWRHRLARQQDLPPLPPVPSALGPATITATGLFVGSTFADRWQDRVAHAGLSTRADATVSLHPEGLLIDRVGAAPVFVPRVSFVAARLAPALAGKMMGEGGLLVLRWRLGAGAGAEAAPDTLELDTGFRADDKSAYPAFVTAINERVTA